jgi:hypothetical protein
LDRDGCDRNWYPDDKSAKYNLEGAGWQGGADYEDIMGLYTKIIHQCTVDNGKTQRLWPNNYPETEGLISPRFLSMGSHGMKKSVLICLITLVFLLVGIVVAGKHSSNKITLGKLNKLWREERYEELLNIGRERLQKNPKDLVGLIIVLQNALFIGCDVETASQAYHLLEAELESTSKIIFKRHCCRLFWREEIPKMIEEMSRMPLDQIKEKRKEIIRQRFDVMPFAVLLLDLEQRGFFKVFSESEETDSIDTRIFRITSDKNEVIGESGTTIAKVFRLWKEGKTRRSFSDREGKIGARSQRYCGTNTINYRGVCQLRCGCSISGIYPSG